MATRNLCHLFGANPALFSTGNLPGILPGMVALNGDYNVFIIFPPNAMEK
jgi:hypothetical protein